MKTLAAALLLLALLPAAAAAKTGLSLNPPPDGLKVGEPWDVSIRYIDHDAAVILPTGTHLAVRIFREGSGGTLRFRAHRVIKEVWAAHVVFPAAGRWDYSIQGLPKRVGPQEFEPVAIAPAGGSKPPRSAASLGAGSSFPYGWVGAGAGLVLLATGLVVARRQRS
jgi:hypothetical protein